MSKHLVTWIVLADGSRARIVEPREIGSGFDVIEELASPEAHEPSRAIWADRPGRTQESGSSARHAVEPRQDPHEARKAAFSRLVAAQLNKAADEKKFDNLILFAPPRCLATLRAALDDATSRKVQAAVPKDLTKLPLAELADHLVPLHLD